MEEIPPVAGLTDRRAFATTHWSVVLAAGEKGSTATSAALAELCRTYWYPVYAYLRRKGQRQDEAQDLTQEFFARFLERGWFGQADRRRGRFRTFLLASLEHFLAKEWNRAHRQKRRGGRAIFSLEGEDAEGRYRLESPDDWTAERIYERRWALTVLERAMAALEGEYEAGGRRALFLELKPSIAGDGSDLSYPDMAGRLSMTEGALRVAVHRLRQRYAEAVRAEIGKVVQRPEEIEEEVHHLFAALG